MRQSFKRLTVAFGMVLVANCCLSGVADEALGKAEPEVANLSRLALWRALPTRKFVRLGQEAVGRSTWQAFAFREPNSRNPEKICLDVISARMRHTGFISVEAGSPECGLGPKPEDPILAEDQFQSPGRTLAIAATRTESVTAELKLSDGKPRMESFRSVGPAWATKARLAPFRFSLVVLRPEVCVRQILGEGAGGSTEFETAEDRCLNE
jgi:hypothetical protein